jgi:hypothetical protein
MSDFPVQDEADLEDGLFDETAEEDTLKDPAAAPPGNLAERGIIVRTKCGHIFHKECLSGWVGGRWQMNPQTNEQDENQAERRRRARQTCCPLCREDLRPASVSSRTN